MGKKTISAIKNRHKNKVNDVEIVDDGTTATVQWTIRIEDREYVGTEMILNKKEYVHHIDRVVHAASGDNAFRLPTGENEWILLSRLQMANAVVHMKVIENNFGDDFLL